MDNALTLSPPHGGRLVPRACAPRADQEDGFIGISVRNVTRVKIALTESVMICAAGSHSTDARGEPA